MSIEARTVGEFEFVVRTILKTTFEAAPFRTRRSTDRHDTTRDIDKVARGTRISIGTEIARVRLMGFARVFDSREHIAHGKRNERIALVILEVRVEIGRILLDEILLEHERFMLVLDHDIFERIDLRNEQRDLLTRILEVHVLAHASAQLLCLAYIDDATFFVLPKIHARKRWHGSKLTFDIFELLIVHLPYSRNDSLETAQHCLDMIVQIEHHKRDIIAKLLRFSA